MHSANKSISSYFSAHLIGMLLVMGSTILFSSKAILVKFVYQFDVEPLVLQTLRMVFVLPCYLLILLTLLKKSGWQHISWQDLLGCAVAGVACYHIASYLDLVGLQYISAGLERIILFCYPAVAVLFGWGFLNEKPTWKICSAIGLAYLGIATFFYADLNFAGEDIWFGASMVFIASVLTAWYLVASQKYSRKLGSQKFTCLAMITASITVVLHGFAVQVENLHAQHTNVYIAAFCIAIFCTLIPSFMMSAGVKSIGASKAGVVGATGPLLTIVLSNHILGEPLTWLHLAGMALVIWGMKRMK